MISWNPLYEVSFLEKSIVFTDERGSFSFLRHPSMATWGFFSHLDEGLESSHIAHASDLERTLLLLLLKKNLVVELPLGPGQLNDERSAGHLLTYDQDPISALQKIRSSQVCLLGVGGVGSVVLQHLLGMGVRNYILVDGDRVEASNLNRQFIFSPDDVGKSKVEVATKFVFSRIPSSQVLPISYRVNSIDDLRKLPIENSDIIINCFDTPRKVIDDIVYGFGELTNIAVITAGVGVYYGHWGPLICPGKNCTTYRDWAERFLTGNDNSAEILDQPTQWSFGPTNTLIGASLALETIEWLGGRKDINSLNTRWVHRFSDNQITSYKAISAECKN